jgi:histidine ammonia-lyase
MAANPVILKGAGLTPEDVAAVARDRAAVEVDPEALARAARSRAVVDKLLQARVRVYGLNTGFGSLRDVHIEPEQARSLQRNLIRSHCCGVGEPAPEDVVRAIMLLRANTLVKGNSGVRPVVIETLVQMLNRGVYPFVPLKGSVGASGDLAPLSHLAAVLMGEGEAFLPDGRRVPGARALDAAGISPVELEAKEGLALNNGTQFMTAIGVLALLDTEYLAAVATAACALSLEAIQGVPNAFDPRLHAARGQPGQRRVAKLLRRQIRGSEILALPVNTASLNHARESLGELEKAFRRQGGELARRLADETRDLCARLGEAPQPLLRGLRRGMRGGRDEPAAEARRAEETRQQAQDQMKECRLASLAIFERVLINAELYGSGEIRAHLESARLQIDAAVPTSLPVQDDYCFRCAPQVMGAALDTFRHVRSVLTRELNAATDNPLIFPPAPGGPGGEDLEAYRAGLTVEDCRLAVVSGGNFHGEPVALALDQACLAVAALGSISERRTFHLTTGHLSNGLPRLLAPQAELAGLQSGMMIAQVTAASLVSENKTLCHPASADSIPTVEDAEDHVSMGAFAARKFAEVVRNVTWVVAIELICAAQGVGYRRPARPSRANRALFGEVRRYCEELKDDRPLGPDIEAVARAVCRREFQALPRPGKARRG